MPIIGVGRPRVTGNTALPGPPGDGPGGRYLRTRRSKETRGYLIARGQRQIRRQKVPYLLTLFWYLGTGEVPYSCTFTWSLETARPRVCAEGHGAGAEGRGRLFETPARGFRPVWPAVPRAGPP